MELLRRATLVGSILPGLWLFWLAPLEPVLTVVPVDFAALQAREAASVPEARRSDAQQRRAQLPLSVYIEESLQYNVYPAAGPGWERALSGIDAAQAAAAGRGPGRPIFVRAADEPFSELLGKLAAGAGTTYVSISRPGGDRHYRVERHAWTRQDFRPGHGFGGAPAPPARLLYPFRRLAAGAILFGIALFALLPAPDVAARLPGSKGRDTAALSAALLLIAAPLVATGGSVQAITRGLALTAPCWVLSAAAVHVFARPARNAPHPLANRQAVGAWGDRPLPALDGLFLREGLAFLAMALAPLAFLVSASLLLWNR